MFIPHGWFVPQGYDLKAFEPIGHLLTVDPPLIHIAWSGGLLPVICEIDLYMIPSLPGMVKNSLF
ncbi:hypothetical protein ACW0KB_14730 [Virgibacillus salarius]|uniref:hypothetical protein n=1 Tax=uncultured Virgibacillus sp. TaxID=417355 RepID=UPI002635BEA4|nr:hypothetical protein [uncultured Virgibacillus sp.]